MPANRSVRIQLSECMSEAAPTSLLETLLRQCQAADPSPWYPRDYAATAGTDRDSLYAPLNDLRLANLVQLTEWVQGKGQGYLITPLGKEVLSDPAFLERLRDGKVPATAIPAGEPTGTPSGSTRFERGEAARRAFYLPGTTRVVPALMAVNILAFLVSMAVATREGVGVVRFLRGVGVDALQKVGALSAPDLAKGEWWRLVTNCFLHFGLMHITLNMTSLALLRRVEALWGPGRFLALYMICAVCGSCAGIYVSPGTPDHPMFLAGASGALWGVLASEVVWLLMNRSHLPPQEVRQWGQQIFFILLLNVGVSMLPNVSKAAHFGGGLAGAIAALLLQVHLHGAPARKVVAGVQLALLPAVFLLGLAVAMEHDSRLQPFMAQEYKNQITTRIAKLGPALETLEPQAEKLHLQESTKRDLTELKRVRDGLSGVIKQAEEIHDWVDKSTPIETAEPLKEKGLAMLKALSAYAQALRKRAGGEEVPDINELRQNWLQSKVEWTLAAG